MRGWRDQPQGTQLLVECVRGLQRSDLQSSSKGSSVFRLPAYALRVGSTFAVSVMASIASSRLSSQTTVQIVVEKDLSLPASLETLK